MTSAIGTNWGHILFRKGGLNSVGQGKIGIGPLNWVSFDPNFETTGLMFTGGWTTSLWFSADGGEHWHNGGTDRIPPPMATADCQSSHLNSNTWFLITGDGDGKKPFGYNTRQVETWQLGRSTRGIKLLDTRRLGSGVYIVELVQDEVQVFSDKFIVRH